MYKKYMFVIFGFSYVFAMNQKEVKNNNLQENSNNSGLAQSFVENKNNYDLAIQFLICSEGLNAQDSNSQEMIHFNNNESNKNNNSQDNSNNSELEEPFLGNEREKTIQLTFRESTELKESFDYFKVLYQAKLASEEFQEFAKNFQQLSLIQIKQLKQIVELKNMQLKNSLSWFSFFQETIISINECIDLINRLKNHEDFAKDFKEEILEHKKCLNKMLNNIHASRSQVFNQLGLVANNQTTYFLNDFENSDTMAKIESIYKYNNKEQRKTNFLKCLCDVFCYNPCCLE